MTRAFVRSLAVFAARDDTRGDVCARSSCELFEEPQIVLREETDVGNAEKNHREAIHAETEGVPGPFLRIVSVVAARFVYLLENRGMHHAGATNFNPLLAAFERFRFHIDLETWLGEGEIMRTETHGGIRAEKFVHEKFDGAFQVGDADVLIDVQTFDLMELRAVRRVYFIATISGAGRDD